MSIFAEYPSPPNRQVYLTEVLFRIALFYSVATLIVGLASWFEAPWSAFYDDRLPLILAQDGALFIVLSCWFGTLATFFRRRFYGATLPRLLAHWILFFQFIIFGLAMGSGGS